MALLMGHRGARGEYPENTCGGFSYTQSLQDLGVEGIEFDVQLTKDGKLAVFHDETASRCVGTQQIISKTLSTRMKRLHQHKLYQYKEFSNQNLVIEGIALLTDVLPYLTGYQHIELEIKTYVGVNKQRLVKTLLAAQSSFSHLPVTFTSFDTELLLLLQQARSKQRVPLGLLIEDISCREIQKKPHRLLNTVKRLGCTQIGIQADLITKAFIQLCHHHHINVTAWTVNEPKQYDALNDMGVDAIITDYPHMFLKTL